MVKLQTMSLWHLARITSFGKPTIDYRQESLNLLLRHSTNKISAHMHLSSMNADCEHLMLLICTRLSAVKYCLPTSSLI